LSALTIYLEGGGDTKEQKGQLRQGMDAFLKSAKDRFREKRWGWKLVACGGRQEAFDSFIWARNQAKTGEIVILLVDSEAPVTATCRADHLRQRQGDGWDLSGVPDNHIHLMVQSMEAWIVADPEALEAYYGQGFQRNALPRRKNLEGEPKADCARKLKAATSKTKTKGAYHKINHASELLKIISPDKVRVRCPHAEILFKTLLDLV